MSSAIYVVSHQQLQRTDRKINGKTFYEKVGADRSARFGFTTKEAAIQCIMWHNGPNSGQTAYDLHQYMPALAVMPEVLYWALYPEEINVDWGTEWEIETIHINPDIFNS